MIFDTIAELISDRTGCEAASVRRESTFKELSIDSLDTVELLMSLEDEVGTPIELTEKLETVGELADFVEKKVKESGNAVADL